MNIPTLLILAVVIAIVVYDVRYLKKHKHSCGCGGSCSSGCSCHGNSCKFVKDIDKAKKNINNHLTA